MHPLIKKFKLPVYKDSIWVVVHPSICKAIDYVEDIVDQSIHMKNQVYRSYFYGYEDHKGITRTILFLKPTAKPGEIAHEVKHLINFVFSSNGVRLSTSNDEHECYYLEYLVDKVHTILNKAKPLFKPIKKIKHQEQETIIQNT